MKKENPQIPNIRIPSIKELSRQQGASSQEPSYSAPIVQINEELVYEENVRENANTFVFGILLILTQIAICIVYGKLVNIPPLEPQDVQTPDVLLGTPNVAPIILVTLVTFLVVVGFGALMSYTRKNVWSALGFHLVLICLTVEIFFIFNNLLNFTDETMNYSEDWQIYLSPLERHNRIRIQNGNILNEGRILEFGNNLLMAMKCALANCIAFSCGLGRWGLLELYFIALFGTILFELNRRLIQITDGIDFSDACAIFIFGGFFGLVLSAQLRWKQQMQGHPAYTGSILSVMMSLLGVTIFFVLSPLLALAPSQKEKQFFIRYLAVVQPSLLMSMFSAVMTGISFSYFINTKPIVRDLINSGIAGVVAGLASVAYMDRPIFPMVVGSTAGIVQVLLQNLVEKRITRKGKIFSTFSWALFAVQGLVGASFASIFHKVLKDSYRQPYGRELVDQTRYLILMALISAAMGIAGGIVLGLIFYFFPVLREEDCFHDRTHWKDSEDCFSELEGMPNRDIFRPRIIPFI